MKNWQFQRALKARGLTCQQLAKLAGCGRAHLSQVINNKPGRGGQTRRKLFPHITIKEANLLGWRHEYREWWMNTSGSYPPELEQSSTGNIVPS